jgi:hypothetical protein
MAFAAVAGGALILSGLRGYEGATAGKPVDFIVDWGGARMLEQGRDPYQWDDIRAAGLEPVLRQNLMEPPFTLGHPPTAFVWLLPLADLPVTSAKIVWMAATMLLVAFMVITMTRSLGYPAPLASAALALGLLVTTTWFMQHLRMGQLGVLIVFFYFLAWRYLRHGNELAAGAMLGLACTLKSYPAALVLLFLLAWRWRVVAAAIAAWLVFAVPVTARFGVVSWSHFLEATGVYTERWVGNIRNASFLGIFQRLRYPVCEFPDGDQKVWTPGVLLALVAFVGLTALAARLARRSLADARRVDVPFAAVAALSTLTAHLGWEHYNVTLIVPFLAAIPALVAARRAGMPWPWVGGAAAAVVAAGALVRISLFAKLDALAAYRAHPPAAHLTVHLLEIANWLPPLLLCAALLAVAAWRDRREPSAPTGSVI